MKRSIAAVFCILPLLALALSCSDSSPPQGSAPPDDTALVEPYSLDERFIPNILVKAKATDVSFHDINDHFQITEFTIEHVYAGPDSLKGDKFRLGMPVNDARMGSRNSETWFYPVATLGEIGIWALIPLEERFAPGGKVDTRICPTAQSLVPMRELRPSDGRKEQVPYPLLPYRQGIGDKYDEMVKWADAVEAAYRRQGAERRASLLQSSKNENPLIANWAADLLERIERADTQPGSHPPPFRKRQVWPTKPATPPRHPSAPQTTMGEVTRPR